MLCEIDQPSKLLFYKQLNQYFNFKASPRCNHPHGVEGLHAKSGKDNSADILPNCVGSWYDTPCFGSAVCVGTLTISTVYRMF